MCIHSVCASNFRVLWYYLKEKPAICTTTTLKKGRGEGDSSATLALLYYRGVFIGKVYKLILLRDKYQASSLDLFLIDLESTFEVLVIHYSIIASS